MTIKEFLAILNQRISSGDIKPTVSELWANVVKQAITHTRGATPIHLLETARPNETEASREYRLHNYRPITVEGTVKAINLFTRIIVNSDYNIVASSELEEWMNNEPLQIDAERVSIEGFASRILMPRTVEDPNALLLAIPINPNNEKIPPAAPVPVDNGGVTKTQALKVEGRIISSDSRFLTRHDAIAWVDPMMWTFTTKKGYEAKAPFYWFVNQSAYWRILPRDKDDKGKTIYTPELWYAINDIDEDGFIIPATEDAAPVANILGGNLSLAYQVVDTINKRNGDVKPLDEQYYRSCLDAYYQYSDLQVNAFSDWQSVSTQYNYPIRAMVGRPCPNDSCMDGNVVTPLPDGGTRLDTCKTCKGNGEVISINPHDTLIIPREDGQNGAEPLTSIPIVQYFNPDVSILESSRRTPDDYRKAAKEANNIDVLEGAPIESGTAKEIRLQATTDMVARVGDSLFDTLSIFLWQCEQIVQPFPEKRVKPVITKPSAYNLKSTSDMLEEAKNAPKAFRVSAMLKLVKAMHRGDKKRILVEKALLFLAPALLWTDDETRIELTTLPPREQHKHLVRKNYGRLVLEEMAEDDTGFLTKPVSQLVKEADERLESFMPAVEEIEPIVPVGEPASE